MSGEDLKTWYAQLLYFDHLKIVPPLPKSNSIPLPPNFLIPLNSDILHLLSVRDPFRHLPVSLFLAQTNTSSIHPIASAMEFI